MSYKAFKVDSIDNGQIARVSINRPKSINAMNPAFFQQLELIFTALNKDWEDIRAVIFVGQGKAFTAGLDLKQFGGLFSFDLQNSGTYGFIADVARQSIKLLEVIHKMQRQFLSIIECKVPVLMGIHNVCVGGGIDLICMADIRYCTLDSRYTIKEVDIGMAADLGTLQIFPNLIGNQSTFRELSYTGRWMDAQQAKSIGLVSKVFETRQKMEEGLLETARSIASKSPVAINTLKHIFRREQYKKVYESIQYMARTNSSMLFSKDTMEAISAFLQKKQPVFPKL